MCIGLKRLKKTFDFAGLNNLDENEENIDEYDMDHNAQVSVTVSPVSKDCCEIIGKCQSVVYH